MRVKRGHTLPELLVVLTLLSLFAVLALPRMVGGLVRTRMDAAVEALRGDLQFARARASATGLRHQVTVDTASGEILVVPFRAEEAVVSSTSLEVRSPAVLHDRLPEQVRISEWSISPLGYQQGQPTAAQDTPPLMFYPEGNSDSARIVLEDRDGGRSGFLLDGFTGTLRDMKDEELRQ